MKKPNILFINTDQQCFDAVSAYSGEKWLHTPNIDRLHNNGVSFRRSYSTDPVCAPARASWMTGTYTSENGVVFNGAPLHDDIPDLGELLNGNGYNAYHCGKWHVPGRQVERGFKNLYFGRRTIVAGCAEAYDPAMTHAAVDLITKYEEEEPFYLQVGYVNPHDICEAGHNYETNDERCIPGPIEQGVFTDEELPPLPENYEYDERETVLHTVYRRTDNPINHAAQLRYLKDWTGEQWRLHRWNYYRFIEKVDQEIGILLNALEATRHKENTLIIFTTDHGEAAGCHRMFQKCTLYEESIHVPFIVSSLVDGFNLPKGTFDESHFVSGVDFLPTVLDYAGIAVPDGARGMSVRKVIEDPSAAWRDCAYVESNYWGRAVISERYKYVTEYIPKEDEDFMPPGPEDSKRGLEQLFDLKDDPAETRNLAGDPEHAAALEELRKKLIEQERGLKRRTIEAEGSRNTITNWGGRIRDYWKTLKT